jgi:hypothetical protein
LHRLKQLEIFFENGALEESIRLFNHDSCPDHQHVLETILTLASAKPKALATRDAALIEQFQQNLTKRLQVLDNPEDYRVSDVYV